ncbi:gluconate 2-dehydrogenase subunit 3 family protein [Salinibaculum rarum]|uniref:gluconate 2-dehydrogenase subunit 3 family protein n=1 Tax=Salinibaculum rarum TaxID=3058903 RepID=UPI00265EC043|nr:gluconate 2-dehydrogenase subunit 3 family protein [Salinibaculum sp. KK48]
MTEYELTRRDAIAALASLGVAAGGALTWNALQDGADDEDGPTMSEHDRELLQAVAVATYPSAVSGIPEFVETYVVGRIHDQPDRLAGMIDALEYVDRYASEWYDTPYLELSPTRQETVLSAMGADVSDPDPDGGDVEQVRFYVVNELLYALYSSPTGGKLLGLENPQGHPGGTESYQHGPPE